MKTLPVRRALLGACCLLLPSMLIASETAPSSLSEAIAGGKASLNVRARFESVEQTGLRDAEAWTVRARLGYTTAAYAGFKAMLEFEGIASPDGDKYSQAGINPGGAGRAVVADPEGSEVNQAWLAYTAGPATATFGRQRLVFDNARFVGDVGWRQNMQTFDGVVLQNKAVGKTTVTYAWLSRINRVFGDKHAQGNWDSNSHLLNVSHTGLKAGTLTGYAYLLDFDNAATQSSATYGASFAGGAAVGSELKFTYRAEYAVQSDHGSSALNYSTDFLGLELGLAAKAGVVAFGYEQLGSDNGASFRTPLATLHAFNGWADLFLTTPGNGLRDTYLKVSANLPGGFGLLGFYHQFTAARLGADYGNEIDLQLTRKFGKSITVLAKYASFRRDTPTFPNVEKMWLQTEYAF